MSTIKTLITIGIISLLIGLSFYVVFDRSYSMDVEAVENFVVPTIDTTEMVKAPEDVINEDCKTDISYDIYKLKENYFKQNQELYIKTIVHYMPNADSTTLSDSIFNERIKLMDLFFENSETNLHFSMDSFIVHTGKPTDNKEMLKSIEGFEDFAKKSRPDLRRKYYGEHVDFHNNILHVDGYLNIFVYNDTTGFSGRAGDIESTYFGVSLKYMHPDLYTFEHEAGHCYGLHHTHAYDASGKLHSTDGGDFVCDTRATFPLSNIVNDNCELFRDWELKAKTYPFSNPISTWDGATQLEIEILITNVMSYTRHQCRENFTPEQVRRMRKILENNKDLRRTVKGLDTNFKQNVLNTIAEID